MITYICLFNDFIHTANEPLTIVLYISVVENKIVTFFHIFYFSNFLNFICKIISCCTVHCLNIIYKFDLNEILNINPMVKGLYFLSFYQHVEFFLKCDSFSYMTKVFYYLTRYIMAHQGH